MTAVRRWLIPCIPIIGLLQGCAIAPSQRDVTNLTTPNIVGNIRCETRDAIRGALAGVLNYVAQDPITKEVARRVADRTVPMREIDLRGMDRRYKKLIAAYKDFAIAYDFTFDGTIVANLNGSATGTDTFPRGSGSFPFTAKLDRSRQNIQNFRQSDTFGDLLWNTPKSYCPDPHRNMPGNYLYPISGGIGVAKQLDAFIALFGLANLAASKENPTGPPVFVSRLVFTTEIEGTARPLVTISPVLGDTTWSGGFGIAASRTDKHEVIIAFSAVRSDRELTDAEIDDFLRGPGVPTQIPDRSAPARRAANEALNETILRFEIGRQPGVTVVNRPLISLF